MVEQEEDIIEKYIKLKKSHQQLYFKYRELINEHEVLKKRLLEYENNKNDTERTLVQKENEQLHAQLKQIKRASTHATPAKKKSEYKQKEFEVNKLINHRGRKPKREFLVRWKDFDESHDSWEKESNLLCPKILFDYLKKTD